MAGAGDVDVAGVGGGLEELAGALLAEEVALAAADQEGGDAQAAGRGEQAVGVAGRGAGAAVRVHEARVPVPAVAAVLAAAEVLPRPERSVGRGRWGR